MSRHLKTRTQMGMSGIIDHYVALQPNSTPRARGVHYFVPIVCYKYYWGAMNSVKEGHRYEKHIVVRRMPYAQGLLQLYTYHFPKTWSAACIANRELIKQAQRQAHALEHAHTAEALEWRVRFLMHYFRVFKGGEQPEPGLKPYSRFYQYTYVCIYRHLQQIAQRAQEKSAFQEESPSLSASHDNAASSPSDISFDPIPLRRLQSFARRRQAFSRVFLGSMTPLLE